MAISCAFGESFSPKKRLVLSTAPRLEGIDQKMTGEDIYKQVALILSCNRDDPELLDPSNLVRRALPPGKLSDLFMLYTASCDECHEYVASERTFLRIWYRGWNKCLRPRKASSHSLCKACHLLKHKLRTAASLTDQAIYSAKLLLHLRSQ